MKRPFENQGTHMFDLNDVEIKEGDTVEAIWMASTLQETKRYKVLYNVGEGAFCFYDTQDGEEYMRKDLEYLKVI
jgi:hypothetical protein